MALVWAASFESAVAQLGPIPAGAVPPSDSTGISLPGPAQPPGASDLQPIAAQPGATVAPAGLPPASWDDWAECCCACGGSPCACGGSCTGSVCGSCKCRECVPPLGRVTLDCPPHPYSYGEIGAIGLMRDSQPSGGPIAVLNDGDNPVLLAKDAWPDMRGGGTARLGRMFGPRFGVEFSYLGTSTWSGDAAVGDQTPNDEGALGNLFSPFGGFGVEPVDGFDYNELVSIQGRTWMESFELGLRQRLAMPPEPLQVSVFYSLRYVNLDERFAYYSQSQVPDPGGSTQWVGVRTNNHLFGAQIGTLMEWHVDRGWWIDARLAAAFLNNSAGQTTHHVETGAAPGENWLENDDDHGSVAAEVSLALVYYLRQNVSAKFGYYFFWVDRVALAAENFETDPVLLRNGPGQLDTDGTIMFHGPFLGLSVAW